MVVFPWLSDEQLTRDNPSRFRLVVHGNRVADAHHEYGSQSPHGTGDRISSPVVRSPVPSLGERSMMDRIFDIGVMIVVVAIIVALVTHAQTAQIINATGQAFANSIKAALGQ